MEYEVEYRSSRRRERGAPLDPTSPTHDLARRRRPPASPASSRRLVQCPPADRPTHGEIAPFPRSAAPCVNDGSPRQKSLAPVPLPRKRSLRHQFPTRHAPRPRRLERRGDMPPALDPTQYHPAIDNVSAGALHRKVRSSSSRRSLVVTIVPPSVTRPSRGVRPSLPTSTPARSAPPNRNSSQAYDDYKRNVASNEPDDPSASASAGADEEDAKRYGTIHPRVWSKDPHGGAYKISSGPGASGGYDALAQRPDGTVIAVEPGYERPAIGPTTNFVGNHMTQGAIDLAQGELTRADPDADRRRERLDFARGTTREPPQLSLQDDGSYRR